jgi:tetratricopeptide (TPR) repeat protein
MGVRVEATMFDPVNTRAEALRKEGFSRVRAEQYDAALELYDLALTIATDEELHELISINKAHALIAVGRQGAAINALPAILMRRRSPHNSFLAAYALVLKHRLDEDLKRASFYGQLAVEIGRENDEPSWLIPALNELGIIYETDSHFDKAIACFEEALNLLDKIPEPEERSFVRTAILQNLGYNKLLVGDTQNGLDMIHSVIDFVHVSSTLADSYIDLCYGYLDLEEWDKARHYGEIGLELATDARQIRNAHYLLGEAAYKAGQVPTAEYHFGELGKFYPQFRNLTNLLFAIDLRRVINFKLS